MPPGTIHMVFTLTPSFCQGSVYYPFPAYDLTLYAIVEEHLRGLEITNTTDIALHGHLFRLWKYYEDRWGEIQTGKKGKRRCGVFSCIVTDGNYRWTPNY